jgi:hypothetical protein
MTRRDALYFVVSSGSALAALAIAALLGWSSGGAGGAIILAVCGSLVVLDLITDRTPRSERRHRGAASPR